MRKVIRLLFIVILFLVIPLTASAQEKVNLSEKDEAAVRSFVASLIDTPIAVVLKAELLPPQTKYHTEFVQEDVSIISDQITALVPIPKDLTGWTKKFSVHFTADTGNRKWEPSISCGSWKFDSTPYQAGAPIGSQDLGIWSHPNEGNKKCPHNQGTDHPGTIAISGAYKIVLDYHENSVSAPKSILTGTWSYNCRYADGSKSGSVPCVVKLVSWEGQYGKMPVPAENQQDQKAKISSQQVVLGLVGLGALIAGGIYLFRRFR